MRAEHKHAQESVPLYTCTQQALLYVFALRGVVRVTIDLKSARGVVVVVLFSANFVTSNSMGERSVSVIVALQTKFLLACMLILYIG